MDTLVCSCAAALLYSIIPGLSCNGWADSLSNPVLAFLTCSSSIRISWKLDAPYHSVPSWTVFFGIKSHVVMSLRCPMKLHDLIFQILLFILCFCIDHMAQFSLSSLNWDTKNYSTHWSTSTCILYLFDYFQVVQPNSKLHDMLRRGSRRMSVMPVITQEDRDLDINQVVKSMVNLKVMLGTYILKQ